MPAMFPSGRIVRAIEASRMEAQRFEVAAIGYAALPHIGPAIVPVIGLDMAQSRRAAFAEPVDMLRIDRLWDSLRQIEEIPRLPEDVAQNRPKPRFRG